MDLQQQMKPILAEPLSRAEATEVRHLFHDLIRASGQHSLKYLQAVKELADCFPYQRDQIFETPEKDIQRWLQGLLPGCEKIVMQTNMSGGYTIAFRGPKNQKRFTYGSAFSERGGWLRARFRQIWPRLVPNSGRPFLFVVNGPYAYFLETS